MGKKKKTRHRSHQNRYPILKTSSGAQFSDELDFIRDGGPRAPRPKRNRSRYSTGNAIVSTMSAEQCAAIAKEVFGGQTWFSYQDVLDGEH